MIMILRIHRNESKKHVAIKLPKRNYVETLNIPMIINPDSMCTNIYI